MTPSTDRREHLAEHFREQFGATATIWARAPGRVDLMGSHTDYNLGFVLTLPIGLDVWIAARPRDDQTVRLVAMNLQAESSFNLSAIRPNPEQRWSDYVRGVARVLIEEGLPLTGFDGVIHGTVPIGSGLSSSAALECASATVFEGLGGLSLDPVRKALLCQRAENQFVGVNCGILDQYTSCLGQGGCALLLDCRDLTSLPVKLHGDIKIVICDTRSRRELAGSEYGQRRADCERGAALLGVCSLREVSPEAFDRSEHTLPASVARRCRFIIEENARVQAMAAALETCDRPAIGKLTAASFEGACDLYEIGAPAMHAMMAAMMASPGVLGARQAGAGFGGCMVAFVEQSRVDVFARSASKLYHESTGVQPEISAVEAAAGAGLH